MALSVYCRLMSYPFGIVRLSFTKYIKSAHKSTKNLENTVICYTVRKLKRKWINIQQCFAHALAYTTYKIENQLTVCISDAIIGSDMKRN